MRKFKIPFIGKRAFKRRHRNCQICKEERYELLDVHRIEWGGEYSNENCVCLCVTCHRKVHNKFFTIIGWKNSTKGKLLHIINEEEQEDFI